MNKAITVKLAGPYKGDWMERPAIPLGTPHFVATYYWADSRREYTVKDIAASPAITHLPTGLKVSERLGSIGQARKIAAALEALPLPWDGSQEELKARLGVLPPALFRWLRVHICGHPETEQRESLESAQSADKR